MWLRKIFTKNERHGNITVERPKAMFYHLTATLWPALVIFLLPVYLFRQFVRILLALIYRKRYGGLISGADMVWALETDEWRSVVTVLYMLKHTDDRMDLLEKIKSRAKEKVFDVDDYPKLTSTCHQIMGQFYLLSNTYALDECVKELITEDNEPFSECTLKDYISKICNEPLPMNGTAMWEVLVSNRPLDTNKEGNYLYPVIFRFNHAVGDGMAFVEFLIKAFHDNSDNHAWDGPSSQRCSEKNHVAKTILTRLSGVLHTLYILYSFIGTVLFWRYLRTCDHNSLHGAKLSGNKIAVWSSEDKPELVSAIRRIRARVQRVTFQDVMHSAISASFVEYFEKNKEHIPDSITVAIPYLLTRRKIRQGPANLTNDFAIGAFTLPTNEKSGLDTLLSTRDHSVFAKGVPDLEVFIVGSRLLGSILPVNWLRYWFSCPGITGVISNVPFTNETSVIVGHTLHSTVFFIPHRSRTGFSFGVLTTAGKISITLAVDKSLISSKAEAQRLIDAIFRNVKRLEMEIVNMDRLD
ncbi:uncharacterized protein LOC132696722 [Cylas formicarius]|uniref:uncharacterized protein LOC132696722 n=1 Tax=Cylas formicarius TaxID=197179 RepID=UPI0029589CD8|nr:uncharacterized protein LOC132696722 [Cylas formicarius]